MVPDGRQFSATVLSFALITTILAGVTLFGTAPVAADQHTFDEAPDLTDAADFQVHLPNEGDNYPGSQNEEGGSIEYFASGDDAFAELDAEEGISLDIIIISADWIDYSACSTDNTEAFGIDRGNNNEGTQYDEDLLEHQRENNFRDDGLDVFFYNQEDFAGDPPYLAPEDAIVAAQGDGSSAGPCLTLTDDPGWYQIQGFTNGTIADNGPDELPSDDAEQVGLKLRSNYIYVCECDSEEEAREELGPPPNEQDDTDDSDDSTPTPTPTPDTTDDTDDTTDDSTPTPEPETPTPTPADTDDSDDSDSTDDADSSDDSDDSDDDSSDDSDDADTSDDDDGPMTPAAGDGPGFGPVLAILALLASAFLASHRR